MLVWLIFGFGLRAMFSMPLRWLKASVVGILLPCGLRRVNRNNHPWNLLLLQSDSSANRGKVWRGVLDFVWSGRFGT